MQPTVFPRTDWAQFLAERADTALAAAQEALERLKDGTVRTARDVVALWNESDIQVGAASGLAGVLAQMHPDEQVRTLAEDREQAVARFLTARGLDRELYEVIAEVGIADAAEIDADSARLIEKVLRDFRRSGVDKDDAIRDRLLALSAELTVVDQEFSRTIREDVRTVRLRPEQLAGMPSDFVDAHPVDDDGLVTLTTDYPDVIPFRTFATDADARRALVTTFLSRAWPQNDATLHRMLELRREKARLLGYANWADFDAEVKMIGTGAAIGEFIERLTALADEPAHRDFDVLLERKRLDDPAAGSLDSSDAMYYAELIRKENFEVDAQQVRQYFPFARVREGLLSVTARLFGVEYVPVDAVTWHEDVAVYDVVREGELLGRIYLDLHPRAGKFKHAAQFDLVRGVAGRQLPEGVLACNFPRGLMEHTDAVTLFHEFGHLVHHILGGQQAIARFSGVATEWDFVEAPSQMLEEWAWDADVLQTFAVNAAGEPIPADLVERMRAAKEFGKGYHVRTQMFYAALSYQLHVDEPPSDVTALMTQLQQRYDLFSYLPGTHFYASFGHLEGYTSGYYTYMWSLVIAKDMFSAFDRQHMFAATVAARYRDEVLARGGSRDAADLVASFLGRPYSFDAFGDWLAQAPAAVSR